MKIVATWKFWATISFMTMVISVLMIYSTKIQLSLEGITFMPHGHCFYWNDLVLVLFLIGEITIWAAYMVISVQLSFVYKHGGKLLNREMVLWFTAFIAMCGLTHLVALLNIFYARYIVEGVLLVFTGFVSVVSAVRLHYAKKVLLEQIRQDNDSVREAIQLLEKAGELQVETFVISERLKQLHLLQLEFELESKKTNE